MMRMDNLVLFFIWVELLSVSLSLIEVECWFVVYCLFCLGIFLVSQISSRSLSWKRVEFCWRLFQHLMRWSCGFFSFSLLICWVIFMYFYMLNHSCISGMTLAWSWWMIIFFWCILRFSLPVFYLVFLNQCSWGRLVWNSHFCCVFMWFVYQGNYSLIKRI